MRPISVAVRRGNLVESRHTVHAVSVRDGELVASAGEPGLATHMRSAAKPLQALPLALEHPELAQEELAIACASHEAGEEQLAAVRSLLERAGASEDDLACGPVEGSRLRHNCSGKHAGMLLVCRTRGWPLDGYHLIQHPLQQEILGVVAKSAGLARGEVETAVDGCGVVCFGLPLERMARMFSKLVREELPGSNPVVAAMRSRPDLIGGPEAVDTRIMRAIPGAIAKRGAEGVMCVGLPDGTGVALKVEDGANRATGPALAAYLGIEELARLPIENSRGEPVGEIFAE